MENELTEEELKMKGECLEFMRELNTWCRSKRDNIKENSMGIMLGGLCSYICILSIKNNISLIDLLKNLSFMYEEFENPEKQKKDIPCD